MYSYDYSNIISSNNSRMFFISFIYIIFCVFIQIGFNKINQIQRLFNWIFFVIFRIKTRIIYYVCIFYIFNIACPQKAPQIKETFWSIMSLILGKIIENWNFFCLRGIGVETNAPYINSILSETPDIQLEYPGSNKTVCINKFPI